MVIGSLQFVIRCIPFFLLLLKKLLITDLSTKQDPCLIRSGDYGGCDGPPSLHSQANTTDET